MSNDFKPTKLGGLLYCPEEVQGTPNWNFTSDGAANSTTLICVDTTNVITHNNNLAAASPYAGITAGRFDYMYVYFYSNTTTTLLQGQVYPVGLQIIDAGAPLEMRLNISETMADTPVGTDTFILFGVVQSSDVSVSAGYENLPRDEFERQTLDLPTANKGLQTVSGSFKFEMYGLIQTLEAAVTPRLDVLSHLLKASGTRSAPVGTTVSAVGGTSTTLLHLTASTTFVVGGWVMVSGEAAQVQTVDSAGANQITVLPALSSIPATAAVVYQGEVYTPPDISHSSLTFLYFQDVQLTECRGCVCSFGVEGTYGLNIMASCEFDGDAWDMQDSFVVDFEQISEKTLPFTAGRSFFGATVLATNSFEFTQGSGRQALRDTVAGQAQYITTRDGSLKVVYRNQLLTTKETWEASGTHALVFVQVGATAGATVLVGGWGQIQDPAESSDVEGHRYWDASFGLRDDQTDSNNPKKPQIVRF